MANGFGMGMRGLPPIKPPVVQSDTDLPFNDPNQVTPYSPEELQQRQNVSDANTRMQQALSAQSQAGQDNGILSNPAFQVGAPALLTALSAIFPRHMRTAGPIGESALNNLQYTNIMQGRTQQAQAQGAAQSATADFNKQRFQYAVSHDPKIDPIEAQAISAEADIDPKGAAAHYAQAQIRANTPAKPVDPLEGDAMKIWVRDQHAQHPETPLSDLISQYNTQNQTKPPKFTGDYQNAATLHPQLAGEGDEQYANRLDSIVRSIGQSRQDLKPQPQPKFSGDFLNAATLHPQLAGESDDMYAKRLEGIVSQYQQGKADIHLNAKVPEDIAQFDSVLSQGNKITQLMDGLQTKYPNEASQKAALLKEGLKAKLGLSYGDDFKEYLPAVNNFNTFGMGLVAKQGGRMGPALAQRITASLPSPNDTLDRTAQKLPDFLAAIQEYRDLKAKASHGAIPGGPNGTPGSTDNRPPLSQFQR